MGVEQRLRDVGLDARHRHDQARLEAALAPGEDLAGLQSPMPASSRSIRQLRIRSFSFDGRRLTIRLPSVLPICTIAPVEIMLRTILVAVPAFSRVEPEMTSGPTSGAMSMSTSSPSRLGRLQAMPTVAAPRPHRADGAST